MKNDISTARKHVRLESNGYDGLDYGKVQGDQASYVSPVGSSQQFNAGGDEKEKRTRSRKWSDEEVDLFLKILGDTRYMFAASLENLVPKKRSNYEIFTNIKNVFRRELKDRQRDRCPGFEYSMSLDLSIEKLRKKYSNLKVEWRRMSSERQGKDESHHLPEPRWYRSVQKLMTDIKIASEKVNRMASIDDGIPESANGESEGKMHTSDEIEEPTFVVISNRSNTHGNTSMYNGGTGLPPRVEYAYEPAPHVSGDGSSEIHSDDSRRSPSYAQASSIYVRGRPQSEYTDYPYAVKKPRVVCCDGATNQPVPNVNDLSNGLKELAELQMKRQQMLVEADLKAYDLFLKHREQEAARNRAHELRLAEVYAKTLSGVHHQLETDRALTSPRQVEHDPYRTLHELQQEMTFSLAYDGSKRLSKTNGTT